MNKIIYLDAAATYQKPGAVIDAEVDFLRNKYANAARGVCPRSTAVDDMVARTRNRVAAFMNARTDQVIFTYGTTDAMNMVADMIPMSATTRVGVSDLDHNSTRLPFVQKIRRKAGRIFVCPLDVHGNYDTENMPAVDVLVITAMSNVMGMAINVPQIVAAAREKNPNVITVVDAAQYVVHDKIDVCAWGCDFVCWSGHKIGADTGVGVLYIREPEKYAPVRFGGGMVNRVVDDTVVFNNAPDVFEAGTRPLTQIAGLIPAVDALETARPDLNLIKYAYDELARIDAVKILSPRDAALVTFTVGDMHAIDVGVMLGVRGVCVRAGNMCASWIWNRFGCSGAVRMSIGAYNTIDDIKFAIAQIKDIVKKQCK